MIKLTAEGVILNITPVVSVSNTFSKREVVIDDSWTDRENVLHANVVAIEFANERMALLDQFMPGQRVSIEAAVNGREYNGRYFTSLRGLGITPAMQQPQPQPYAPQQPAAYPPQQQPQAYPPQQPAYSQPQPQAFGRPQQYPNQGFPPQGGPQQYGR
jgi:hypothetical protein